MVEPIDHHRLNSTALKSKGDDFGLFGNSADKRRENRFVRKTDTDLFGSDDKFGTSPSRSFLKKSAALDSEDLSKSSVSAVKSTLEPASQKERDEGTFRRSAEGTNIMRTQSNENVVRESAVVSENAKNVAHYRSQESLRDEPKHDTISSTHVSPRDKFSAHISSPRASEPERERSTKQVRYLDTDDAQYSSARRERFDDLNNEISPCTHPYHDDQRSNSPNGTPSNTPSQEKSKKPRPKSSSLWEKIKRRDQREQQLRERGFFEHAPPDFVDMSNEPDFCGDREQYDPAQYPKRRTLFYSKKGGDSSYIDVVAEVQKEDGAYIDIQAYDEPEPKGTLCMKYGRAMRMEGNAKQYAYDDSALVYSVVNNTKELRQVVYDDWLTRKAALVRAEQKRREALKKEEARRREEDFKNKIMASQAAFMQWKKEKEKFLDQKKSKEAEDKEKELKKLNKKEEVLKKQKQYIKAWVNERPKTAVDAEKQAIERRRRAKEEKQRMEEEQNKKKELSEAAFKKWQEEKQDYLKKQQIEMTKQLKAQKAAEFAKRLERDQLAVTSYEQWLERKERDSTEETKLRRTTSAIGGGSMGRLSSRSDFIEERPPWFPASRTVPRKFAKN